MAERLRCLGWEVSVSGITDLETTSGQVLWPEARVAGERQATALAAALNIARTELGDPVPA